MSPNIAPPIIEAKINGNGTPLFSAKPIAIGVIETIAPTDVPVAVDIKAAIIKSPAAKKCGGIYVSPRLTVELTPPIFSVTLANAPAKR